MFAGNSYRLLSFSLIITLTLACASVSTSTAQLLDRIIAIVNDDIITLSELEEAGKDFIRKIENTAPEEELDEATKTAKDQILNQLINQKLISQEASKAKVTLSDKEFEDAYEKNVKAMNLSREEWVQKLEESNLSEETYKSNLRSKLLRDKLILYEIRSKVIITEDMINDYYTNEYGREVAGGGFHLLQMGFTWDESDTVSEVSEKSRAYTNAQETWNKVKNGGDFKALAREFSQLPSASDGGDLGIFQYDELAEYMRNAVIPLEAGEISSIIETPNGYQFFKLVSRKEGGLIYQAPLFEVRDEIRKELFEEKFKEEYSKWVGNIKKGAYIKKMLH